MMMGTFVVTAFYLGGAFQTYHLRRHGDKTSWFEAMTAAFVWPAHVGEQLATASWVATRIISTKKTENTDA